MPDYNIALGVQVPDAMKSISGMLNFAGQALDIRKKSETLAADIEQREGRVRARRDRDATYRAETAQPRITASRGGDARQAADANRTSISSG
jgi:hypothetical protein